MTDDEALSERATVRVDDLTEVERAVLARPGGLRDVLAARRAAEPKRAPARERHPPPTRHGRAHSTPTKEDPHAP